MGRVGPESLSNAGSQAPTFAPVDLENWRLVEAALDSIGRGQQAPMTLRALVKHVVWKGFKASTFRLYGSPVERLPREVTGLGLTPEDLCRAAMNRLLKVVDERARARER